MRHRHVESALRPLAPSRGAAAAGLALFAVALAAAIAATYDRAVDNPPPFEPTSTARTTAVQPAEASDWPSTPTVRSGWVRDGQEQLTAFEATIRDINAIWESDAPGDGARRKELFGRLRTVTDRLAAIPVPTDATAETALAWRETVSALAEGVTLYERWQSRSARYNVRTDDLLTRSAARLRAGLASANAWRRTVGPH